MFLRNNKSRQTMLQFQLVVRLVKTEKINMKFFLKNINYIAVFLFALMIFLKWEKGQNKKSNLVCGRFPEEKHITYDNVVWQVLEISENRLIKIMNAYLDERPKNIVVRVNVVSPKIQIIKDLVYCQFWYEGDPQPIIVKAKDFKRLWSAKEHSKFFFPYFINCPVPKSTKSLPISVSLVANPCDYAENNLKIIDNQPVDGVKKKFAVCYKSATYTDPDFAIRFIEWVHWMQIMGADKIYFSYRFLHPKIFEVVKYFENQGVMETWPYYEPSGVSHYDPDYHRDYQTWILEGISLNDCFYRIRKLYNYVVILDFDEVFIPSNNADKNWSDLIERVNGSAYDTVTSSVYLVDKTVTESNDIPKNLYTLRHLYFHEPLPDDPGKSIFNTDNVYVANNHAPIKCITRECKRNIIKSKFARVYHYRNNVTYGEHLKTGKIDVVMKFKDELIRKVDKTLADLK